MQTNHQQKQKEIIGEMDRQARHNALNFSSVVPVEDYLRDQRIGLTSVHIPNKSFIQSINSTILEPLKAIEPNHLYYTEDMFHITLKGIRVINNPPHFSEDDILIAHEVFSEIVPKHTSFNIYFYKFILFPNNLSIVGTTDPQFDDLFLDLDSSLRAAGLPDDKHYLNSKYFFCNLSLCRFKSEPSSEFVTKVKELEENLKFDPLLVDSVTLVKCNAVFMNKTIYGSWDLAEA